MDTDISRLALDMFGLVGWRLSTAWIDSHEHCFRFGVACMLQNSPPPPPTTTTTTTKNSNNNNNNNNKNNNSNSNSSNNNNNNNKNSNSKKAKKQLWFRWCCCMLFVCLFVCLRAWLRTCLRAWLVGWFGGLVRPSGPPCAVYLGPVAYLILGVVPLTVWTRDVLRRKPEPD